MTEQFQKLLDYQKIDFESDKVERAVASWPERKDAIARKKKFEALADNRKKLFAHLEKLKCDLNNLEGECSGLIAESTQIQATAKDEADDLELLDTQYKQLKSISDRANELGEKIRSITQSAQQADKMLIEQTASANAAREEYQACKQKYDERLKQEMPAIEAARARRAEAAKGVEPDLMRRYKALREGKKVPTAKLIGSTCSGCNMMLPSAIVSRVANGTEVVECENCSRMLYI